MRGTRNPIAPAGYVVANAHFDTCIGVPTGKYSKESRTCAGSAGLKMVQRDEILLCNISAAMMQKTPNTIQESGLYVFSSVGGVEHWIRLAMEGLRRDGAGSTDDITKAAMKLEPLSQLLTEIGFSRDGNPGASGSSLVRWLIADGGGGGHCKWDSAESTFAVFLRYAVLKRLRFSGVANGSTYSEGDAHMGTTMGLDMVSTQVQGTRTLLVNTVDSVVPDEVRSIGARSDVFWDVSGKLAGREHIVRPGSGWEKRVVEVVTRDQLAGIYGAMFDRVGN